MQQHVWGEDELHSLQRLPGQKRTTHTQSHPQPDNFAYIVLVESTYHTDDTPFCFSDPGCPCHRDRQAIEQVNTWVQQGLMTEDEATNFVLGRTF